MQSRSGMGRWCLWWWCVWQWWAGSARVHARVEGNGRASERDGERGEEAEKSRQTKQQTDKMAGIARQQIPDSPTVDSCGQFRAFV